MYHDFSTYIGHVFCIYFQHILLFYLFFCLQDGSSKEVTSASSEGNSVENARNPSSFRNSATRSRENDRKSVRNFNSLENTLSLGAVNGVIISGPVVPAKPAARRPFSGRNPQNSGFLPTPQVAEPNLQELQTPRPFLFRENRPKEPQEAPSPLQSRPVDQTIAESTPLSVEQSTSENYPVFPAEYSTQVQDEKLLHHQSHELHYEVTEEAEKQEQPFRRRKPGKVRKNRNTGVTELPIERLFSTTEHTKLTGISINPGRGFRTKVIKIKPTSVAHYVKGHEENKQKYRYDLFNKQGSRSHLTLKFKKANKTSGSQENEKDSEQDGGDSPPLKFAESQQTSSVEIVLPGSLSLSENEEIYLTSGKYLL